MPTISALPTAPARNQAPATFIANADAWVAALSSFVTQANALAAQASSDSSNATTQATNASTSATNAANSATSAANSATAAAASAGTAAGFTSTSATSLAIGTGSKVLTTQSGKQYTVGAFVTASSAATPTNFMYGQVTAYSGTSLTVSVTGIGGAGTAADWNISLSGTQGAAGALSGTTTASINCNEVDKGTVGTGTVTFTQSTANVQRLQVSGALTIATTGWPTSGTFGELLLKLVNAGSAVVTLPTINWVKPDGTVTTSFTTYMSAISRAALQTSGTDFMYLWSDDAGTTIYGKLL